MKTLFLFSFVVFLLILVAVPPSFAQNYDIYINMDSDLPGCQSNNSCWSVNPLTINQYETVTWHNESLFTVSISSGNVLDNNVGLEFDSDILLPSRSYSHTFENSGTFSYFSLLQPWMGGTIIVNSAIMPDDYEKTNLKDIVKPDDTVTCGPGTEMVNGFCKLINSEPDDAVTCGSGTAFKDGKCVPASTTDNLDVDSDNGGGCLIATAAYGTELAPQVQQLREIRDNKLLQTEYGSSFMSSFNVIYYSFSPYIADYQRENNSFNEVVKLLITPMISSLYIMEYAESESDTLSLGLGVVALNGLFYVGIPAATMLFTRKVLER